MGSSYVAKSEPVRKLCLEELRETTGNEQILKKAIPPINRAVEHSD
jgi:hypothetical protein